MLDRLRRLLPSRETVQAHPWLRWLAPHLTHPRLWHMSRRGIAIGVALGVFFGLLVPVAQIPLSAGAAVLLRANLPCAVASTLVTNPVTFAPVYVAAWKVGGLVLGTPQPASPPVADDGVADHGSWWRAAGARVAGVGKPLVAGLAIFAVAGGLLAYAVVTGGWWLRTRWRRRNRLRQRAAARHGRR